MDLAICEHPVRIYNKTTKRYDYVPCGKCNTCRNKRASAWVDRLETERKCWPYTLFFTLTYSEEFVPRMHLNENNVYVDTDTGEYFDYRQYKGFNLKELNFMRHKKSIEYVSVLDVQRFMKRIRYFFKFYTRNTGEYEKVRYYIVSEYGPTTLRPHYHGLLFFKSQTAASKISEILLKSWKYGLVDSSFAKSAATSYVAQYLNSFVCLPKIYQFKPFRPFCVCSKCPPIGSLAFSSQEIRQMFSDTIVTRQTVRKRDNQLVDVPHWRFYESCLYPKVQGFSRLSHYERIMAYGAAKFSNAETFEDFKSWIDEQLEKYDTPFTQYVRSFYDYVLVDDFVFEHRYNVNSLKRLWSISNRVLCQCAIFDISLDDYVSKIELFYSKKDYYKLVKQMEFEVEFSKLYGAEYLVYLDPVYVTELKRSVFYRLLSGKSFFEPLTNQQKLTLEGFSIDPLRFSTDAEYCNNFNLFSHPEFKEMVRKNYEIFRNNTKTKVKNDYLLLHPELRVHY